MMNRIQEQTAGELMDNIKYWVQNEMTGGHDDLGTNWNVTWNSTSVENKMTDAHEHQNKNWNFWECLNCESLCLTLCRAHQRETTLFFLDGRGEGGETRKRLDMDFCVEVRRRRRKIGGPHGGEGRSSAIKACKKKKLAYLSCCKPWLTFGMVKMSCQQITCFLRSKGSDFSVVPLLRFQNLFFFSSVGRPKPTPLPKMK